MQGEKKKTVKQESRDTQRKRGRGRAREKVRDTCGYDDNSFPLGRGQKRMEMERTKKRPRPSKAVESVGENKNSSLNPQNEPKVVSICHSGQLPSPNTGKNRQCFSTVSLYVVYNF